ncbi:MAG TPA: hypothetical protein VKB78_15630 [Pirellulales bacterium]|nr:hypothetical protein [Pirellulales bacterium]
MKKSFILPSVVAASVLGIAGLLFVSGCPSTSGSSTSTATTVTTASASQFRGPLLHNGLHVLTHLENFDQEPALEQVIDRLNQWARTQTGEVDWKPDPLIATLPKQYQNAIWFEKLDDKSFDHDLDGTFLMEARWLRDISDHARGRTTDDLAVAEALFDWTIRNIELIDVPAKPTAAQALLAKLVNRRLPADVILHGHGTMTQRAWVFMLLGRQQQLDIVMLAVPDPDRGGQPRPWLPALLYKGQLYLFDTSLGLPIPGPGGKGIATLAQAAEDESILKNLDLDEAHHYPIKAAEAKQAMAFIEASPGYLSRRMRLLESQLVSQEKMVLTASPKQIAKQLKDVAHLSPDVKLWTLPYETYVLRSLEQNASPGFRELLVREAAPFKVPGFHGSRATVLKPGERLEHFNELIREGEMQTQKINSAITPGKADRDARMVFQVKNPSSDFDHLEIAFVADPGIEPGHETVKFDNRQPQKPRLEIHIAKNKTKANDILNLLKSDPVASQIVDADRLEGASGEGIVDVGDSVFTSKSARRLETGAKRPVQIVFPLWAARILQFHGLYDGESGAKHFYLAGRPGNDQFGEYVAELLTDYKEATKQDPTPAFAQDCTIAMARRKQAATFWLGVVSFEEGQYEAATDWFKMVPTDTMPSLVSGWVNGARYNLARSYEAAGKKAEAIKLLEEDDSPQRHGNRLRARQLKAADSK